MESWVSISQFLDISRNYGCPFQGIFDIPELWPIHSFDCRIMALKSTRIYGIVGTDFAGKMASPRHMIG